MHLETIKTLLALREAATAENGKVWRKAFDSCDYDRCDQINDSLRKIDNAFFECIRSLRGDISL
jgi:hypothetical protein